MKSLKWLPVSSAEYWLTYELAVNTLQGYLGNWSLECPQETKSQLQSDERWEMTSCADSALVNIILFVISVVSVTWYWILHDIHFINYGPINSKIDN